MASRRLACNLPRKLRPSIVPRPRGRRASAEPRTGGPTRTGVGCPRTGRARSPHRAEPMRSRRHRAKSRPLPLRPFAPSVDFVPAPQAGVPGSICSLCLRGSRCRCRPGTHPVHPAILPSCWKRSRLHGAGDPVPVTARGLAGPPRACETVVTGETSGTIHLRIDARGDGCFARGRSIRCHKGDYANLLHHTIVRSVCDG